MDRRGDAGTVPDPEQCARRPAARRHRPRERAGDPALHDAARAVPPGPGLRARAPRLLAAAPARSHRARPLGAPRLRSANGSAELDGDRSAHGRHRDRARGRAPARRPAPGALSDPPPPPRRGAAMLEAVGMNEINKIFAVTDAMGIHREAVVIPLGTGKGRVRKLLNGKLEIVVDAERPIDEWLTGLPDLIRAVTAP